ncbi:ribosomal protection-like ABC-F family protein [Pseudomonas syringae]|uniref:ribosomal protection-like ABC-F family protein n=1 Tax=Pseudomonas syringae TaxID=317 RepID=UPI00196806AF|nr:ATP-binding cassette domain-containing protein [Pseudomonas syringae]
MGAKASSLASQNDTAPALRVRDLRKTYDNGTQALKGVSLEVAPGDFFALLGPNGAGKSTLIGIISSLVNLSEGKVEVFGSDLVVNRSATMRLIGLVPQEINFNLFEKPFDILVNYAGFYGVPREEAEQRAEEELKRAHLWEKAQVMSRTLSGGMKRRVLLARALVSSPDVLLLDEPTNHLDINTIRWLENILTQRNSLMIIISHDRHFLNSVCTHMADLDYGELRLFPGNYDEYMTVATQSREQLLSDNAKKKAQISELQSFVSRFSANASKAKQATSRAKAIDKIQLAEVKPSSRVSPFIRFEQTKKLHRQAVIVDRMAKGFDGKTLFKDFSFQVEAGERVAIIGPNGIGKTTLLRTLVDELQPDAGTVKWTDAAEIGYYAQDHAHDFEDDSTLFDWMGQWTQGGEQMVRGTLGRMLFSNDEILKSVKVISGGEQGRMLFGKLILQKPNVLVMDEPTNHLDMESIESLNLALENYPGTLIFVSHDREFVSSLATRIIELSPSGVVDFSGTYDDYLRSQGVTF